MLHICICLLINYAQVDVTLKLPEVVKPPVKKSEEIIYESLPEIKHLFREAEKRPPQIVSDVFSVLAIAPFLILMILVRGLIPQS